MTPQQGAAKLRAKANAIRAESVRALNKTAATGVQLGRANSSGLFSQSQLTKAGHPFAVRRPQPAYEPMIINVQTGRFRAAWQRVAPRVFAGGLLAWIVNNSPVAGFLAGRSRPRSRMVRRAVDDLTMIDTEPVFYRNVLAAIRKALRA